MAAKLALSDDGDSPHMDGTYRYRIVEVDKVGAVAWVRLSYHHADTMRKALQAYQPDQGE